MQRFQAYIDANRKRYLDELGGLLPPPRVPAHREGPKGMAGLVPARLERLGAVVRRYEVGGSPPILYAELGQGAQTLLVYNHYDVQPADPLDEWQSPPFQPQVRDGHLYGRGVADDKGDLLCRLQAIEAYQEVFGGLPLRVKFLIEGEEEVGSPHLRTFAEQHADFLEADGCLWEGGEKDSAGRFVLTLGVKGICYLELAVATAATDMHSMWGGIVPNAAWRLTWALSSLKNEADEILIDGLLEHVRFPTAAERAQLAALPFAEDQIREDFGFGSFVRGLTGVDLLAKHFYEPTCTICGLKSGYIQTGAKTVLPNTAVAKVDIRLVPDLTPELVQELVRAHLDRRGFFDVEMRCLNGMRPARSPLDSPFVQACSAAARATYGSEPLVYPTSPGSGPLHTLARETPAVMAGVANAGSRLHAPNENIRVQDYYEGIRFVGELIRQMAEQAGH